MIAGYRVGLAALVLAMGGMLTAAPAPEQQAYWWMDELRTVAFALSEARSGKVATWPRMTVPAGAATWPRMTVPRRGRHAAHAEGRWPRRRRRRAG